MLTFAYLKYYRNGVLSRCLMPQRGASLSIVEVPRLATRERCSLCGAELHSCNNEQLRTPL
ncbi:hypothetical protein J6590_064483 [Homalodisca vitripennis]|nr:hypothetical protein J6590_064483 [Homalodisca vitripennis]